MSQQQWLVINGSVGKRAGMDWANHALIHHLAESGHLVHVAAFSVSQDLADHPNVRLHSIPKLLNSNFFALPRLARDGRRLAAEVLAGGGRVVVNGGNCDVNDVNWVHHVHAADAHAPVANPLYRMKNNLNMRRWRKEELARIPRAGVIITTCVRTRDDIVRHLGVPVERINVVHLGIDADHFAPLTSAQRIAARQKFGWTETGPYLLLIGALGDGRKGLDVLYAAWKRLCQRPDFAGRLTVVGRGANLPSWRARVAQDGLAARVQFIEFVENLPELYSAADMHVLPSRYEGYSLVTQEALCCGTPALISGNAGIADQLSPKLADFLIDNPQSVDAVQEAIMRVWTNIDSARQRTAAFAQELRRHTWQEMSRQMVEIIQRTPPPARL